MRISRDINVLTGILKKRWQRSDGWQGDSVILYLRLSELFEKSCCNHNNEKKRATALKWQPASRTSIKRVPGKSAGLQEQGWTKKASCVFSGVHSTADSHYVEAEWTGFLPPIQTRLAFVIYCVTVWDKEMFHLHSSHQSHSLLISFQFACVHPWLHPFCNLSISFCFCFVHNQCNYSITDVIILILFPFFTISTKLFHKWFDMGIHNLQCKRLRFLCQVTL